jgi:hypothetical protein
MRNMIGWFMIRAFDSIFPLGRYNGFAGSCLRQRRLEGRRRDLARGRCDTDWRRRILDFSAAPAD